MMERIGLNTDMQEMILIMSEGNPGGLRVLVDILKRKPDLMKPEPDIDSIPPFMMILNLDDMNIRGSDIWVGYKDHCGEDLVKFLKAIKNRDGDMIMVIREHCQHGERPVQSGGSSSR